MFDIIIIGAGPAGLTAAIYARRAGKEVLIYEGETYGGQIISTPHIENFPGIKHVSGYDFATTLYEQAMDLGAKFEYDKVSSISGNLEEGFTVTSEFTTNTAKTVIIATGAINRHLGLPLEDKFLGAGISYCATCDGAFFNGKDVFVVGGGNTAFEDAIYLSGICNNVTLIHRREGFRADASLLEQAGKTPNLKIITNKIITKLHGENNLTGITISDSDCSTDNSFSGNPVNSEHLSGEGLFVAIGQVPSSDFLNGFINLDSNGYIIAGENCQTNVPGIFAAGDGRTKSVRQLTTATCDGTVSAISACELC